MDNDSKAKLRKKISRLASRNVLDGKRIVIFGAAAASKEIKTCLLELGYIPSAVIDNDPRKIGKQCMALTVQKPEDTLLPFDDNAAILLCSGGFYREITYQLTQLGYQEDRHIYILNFKSDESLISFTRATAFILQGIILYKRLMRRVSPNTMIFVAPYTGTGDIYLAGLFLTEYVRRNNIENYIFVVVSGACKKVAEMFEIRNIRVIKPQIADTLTYLEKSLKVNRNIKVLNDGWRDDQKQWLRGYKDLSFDKVFRYFVFGFDDDVPYELPPRKDCSAEIEALCDKHNLVKGKTVILSPYSNTLFELPNEFWETIAEHCSSLGYSVCTNCAGKSELPVKGTEAVFFPLKIAIDFADAAGYFIGIRSGLCDVISSSSCKKIILYEKEGFFYKSSPYEYFSLNKMGLCNDAIEMEYRFDLKQDVMDVILRLMTTSGGNKA